MSKKKYLIIGQGIAGSVLALEMWSRKIDFLVIDQPSLSSSSKIAAGLVNPIVLKRFKMVKDAEQHLSIAQPFYHHWQKALNTPFYYNIPICHLFSKQENQNEWMEKSANPPFSKFLGEVQSGTINHLTTNYGYGLMKGTSWMDTSLFLRSVQDFLIQENKLLDTEVNLSEIENLKEQHQASDVIICNGHLLRLQNDFSALFSATRGELLTIKTKDLSEDLIIHAGVFILPLGNKLFKVGATYHWDHLFDETSDDGKSKLIHELEKMFSGNYEIIKHEAGVRPNTKDRKPFLGHHKHWNIFNGLGSRGVLMAPYLAKLMVDNLEKDIPIPAEYDIQRFFSPPNNP